jgi:hypothetical protein
VSNGKRGEGKHSVATCAGSAHEGERGGKVGEVRTGPWLRGRGRGTRVWRGTEVPVAQAANDSKG